MSLIDSVVEFGRNAKALALEAFGVATDGRVSVLGSDLSRQSFPAREGLGVLVKGNPNYTAYYAPVASASGLGAMSSFAAADAMINGGVNEPPAFMIVTKSDGGQQTSYVSKQVAVEYSRVVAEMVEAAKSHRLESLPDLEALSSEKLRI